MSLSILSCFSYFGETSGVSFDVFVFLAVVADDMCARSHTRTTANTRTYERFRISSVYSSQTQTHTRTHTQRAQAMVLRSCSQELRNENQSLRQHVLRRTTSPQSLRLPDTAAADGGVSLTPPVGFADDDVDDAETELANLLSAGVDAGLSQDHVHGHVDVGTADDQIAAASNNGHHLPPFTTTYRSVDETSAADDSAQRGPFPDSASVVGQYRAVSHNVSFGTAVDPPPHSTSPHRVDGDVTIPAPPPTDRRRPFGPGFDHSGLSSRGDDIHTPTAGGSSAATRRSRRRDRDDFANTPITQRTNRTVCFADTPSSPRAASSTPVGMGLPSGSHGEELTPYSAWRTPSGARLTTADLASLRRGGIGELSTPGAASVDDDDNDGGGADDDENGTCSATRTCLLRVCFP